MTLLILILAALAGGLFSLIGGVLLLNKRIKHAKIIAYAMPFAAGAFLGAAFFSILPEAMHLSGEASHSHQTQHAEKNHEASGVTEPHSHDEHSEEVNHQAGHDGEHDTDAAAAHEAAETNADILLWVLGGFVLFFVMERGIRSFHQHHEHAGENSHKSLIIIGDTLHNAIDGVAIGAAFLVNIPLGIATTIAVAAHEIPQEIGDFGILLSKGMKARRVLIVNVLSSLATVVTAVLTFSLGASIEPAVPFLLAIVAGMFIYIAAADIIPSIHEQPQKRIDVQTILLFVGIAVVPLAAFIMEAGFGLSHSH